MADLLQIRQKFVELSGRDDLASTSQNGESYDLDSGADWFINGGKLFLDLVQDSLRTSGKAVEELSVGASQINLRDVRSITRLYYIDNDGGEQLLEKLSLDEILETYPKMGGTEVGVPKHWAQEITRVVPWERAVLGTSPEIVTVRVLPPPEVDTRVNVYGKFHALTLIGNTDVNYWSAQYPQLLVLASLRMLELFYRNSQGVNDFDNGMASLLQGIDRDLAELAFQDSSEMNG
jgi:hypothetical protein